MGKILVLMNSIRIFSKLNNLLWIIIKYKHKVKIDKYLIK